MNLRIETTNRCVLACPACPRTQWKDLVKMPVVKQDLCVEDLVKFLDCEGGRQIDRFLLCGDYGDTIYYPDLFKLIDTFRSTKSFTISTNGSYQTLEFWQKLASRLTSDDVIIFGIDGDQDTNHLYRKNADWASTMMGLDIMAQSPARVLWQTIVFSFNYKKLDQLRALAESHGAEFYCIKTHRYGDDSLIPGDTAFIQTEHMFQERYVNDNNIEIDPRCRHEKSVTCDGYFYPCDWIRNPMTLYKSQLWKQPERWLNQLRIAETDYDTAMRVVDDWADFVKANSIAGSDQVDVLCKMKCRKGCSQERRVWI